MTEREEIKRALLNMGTGIVSGSSYRVKITMVNYETIEKILKRKLRRKP